jgi:hypothetical protein
MLLEVLLMLGTAQGTSSAVTVDATHASRVWSETAPPLRLALFPTAARAFSLLQAPAERAYPGFGALRRPVVGVVVACTARFLTVSPRTDEGIVGPSAGARADARIIGDVSPCLH